MHVCNLYYSPINKYPYHIHIINKKLTQRFNCVPTALRSLELILAILDSLQKPLSTQLCEEYAPGLFLPKAGSSCTEQIDSRRKSDTETAKSNNLCRPQTVFHFSKQTIYLCTTTTTYSPMAESRKKR